MKYPSDQAAAFDHLAALLQSHGELVDAELNRILPAADVPPAPIHEAMRYSIFSGGKRLRPALVLLGCEACGGSLQAALPAACAFEMIHTYSLIHDDLPAMDNDDFRRGRLTCHKAFNEAIAILAGDALLTHAFEVLANGLPNGSCGRLVAEIAAAAGTPGMIGGQIADICSEHMPPDSELVRFIHDRKTAALIRQAVRTGAIIARADSARVDAISSYGANIGLAFQIVDDILDVEGSIEQLGKKAGKDAESGKQTYPGVFGLEASRQKAAELVALAKRNLEPIGAGACDLCALADFVITRKK
ncbi:MAG TPA: farnesyl diphosphate synthase [Planctomycetota bacterium]|nr:farnesyl diphosphate synthase [Planctomycetota bacterium]